MRAVTGFGSKVAPNCLAFPRRGLLDRLHVVVAPIIIGAGPSSVTLPPIARLDHPLRAPIRAHVIGDEVLLDCDLGDQRRPIGAAKKSV
jgi:riboflavin biosynthesis pyrimidine reductase